MKYLVALYLLAFCALPVNAQFMDPPEFGDFGELKGKRTIYILSENLEARKAMVKIIEEAIRKKKIDALLVGEPDAGEIWIIYGSSYARSTTFGELLVSLKGSPVPNTEKEPGGTRYRHRIVYSTQSSRVYSGGIPFSRSAHKKAIRKFLNELSKLQKTK